jgi:hypothetical protein
MFFFIAIIPFYSAAAGATSDASTACFSALASEALMIVSIGV